MTNPIGTVAVKYVADVADYKKNVASIKSDTQSASSSMKGGFEAVSGAIKIFAGAAVIGFAAKSVKGAIDDASNLGEAINASGKVFKDNQGVIHDWGKNAATQAGLSERAFNQMAAQTGALLKNLGYDTKDAATETINLTKRAADMASIFNTDVDQALGAIQSGLKGEFNPLEQFGVKLNASTVSAKALSMGLAKTTSELTDNDKATAALALIYEQTADLAGDFADTSDGLANSQRILDAEVEDLSASIGRDLAPVAADVVHILADLVHWTEESRSAMADHEKMVRDATDTYREYSKELDKNTTWIQKGRDASEKLTEEEYNLEKATKDAAAADVILKSRVEDATKATDGQQKSTKELKDELNKLDEIVGGKVINELVDFTTKQVELTKKSEELKKKIQELGGEEYLTPEQLGQVKTLQGELNVTSDKIRDLDRTIKESELNKKQAEQAKQDLQDLQREAFILEGKIRDVGGVPYLTDDQRKQLQETRDELAENETAIANNVLAHEEANKKIIFGYLEQAAARDGLTETEIRGLTEIGKALGIYDTTTANTMDEVNRIWSEFNQGGSIQDTVNDVLKLNSEINKIDRHVDIHITTYRTEVNQGPRPNQKRQHGGSFIVPAGFPNDSYLVGLTSGEKVDVTPATTNNRIFNLTANYPIVDSEVSLRDHMRALNLGR